MRESFLHRYPRAAVRLLRNVRRSEVGSPICLTLQTCNPRMPCREEEDAAAGPNADLV